VASEDPRDASHALHQMHRVLRANVDESTLLCQPSRPHNRRSQPGA
jgi:hypothetical protein